MKADTLCCVVLTVMLGVGYLAPPGLFHSVIRIVPSDWSCLSSGRQYGYRGQNDSRR